MGWREVPEGAIDWVERLHATVDELTRPVAEAYGEALACSRGCAGCCVDDLTVFEIEAAALARRYPELFAEGEPRAEGACALLDDEGACRAYEARPYVCRTQGLPLRWLERDADGAAVEARDVCELNLVGVPLEELPADACWTLGPVEQRLAERQAAVDGGEERRVKLRDMFARRDASSERVRLPIVR